MRSLIIAIALSALTASGSIAFNKETVRPIDRAVSVPTTIDLNDVKEENIRSYYSNLNSLEESQRQGTNLLKNLKPILKEGQRCYEYGEQELPRYLDHADAEPHGEHNPFHRDRYRI